MPSTTLPAPVAAAMPVASRRRDALWLAVPGLLFLAAFLLAPVLQLLSISVTDLDSGEFSIAAYARAFRVPVYTRIIGTTFGIALQVTLTCLLLGYPLAYWLSRLPARRQRMMTLLVLLPFWTSALVKNFAWLVLLGRTGIIAGTLQALGIDPPDLLFNRGVVVFAMVHSMLPLAVISMLSVMTQIDGRLVQAAGTLGASRVAAFWRVWVPMSMPGVASAGLLVFIGSLGYFITPALLGSPRETMISQAIINQVQQMDNMVFAAALSALLIAAALLTCLLYDRVFSLSAMSGGGGGVQRAAGSPLRRFGLWSSGWLARGFGGLADGLAQLLGGHRFGWLLPAYAWAMVALLILPILSMIPMAFTSSNFMSFPPPGLSLRWFAEYFASPVWMTATLRSFGIGIATAIFTVTLATLAAFGLTRSSSAKLSSAAFLLILTPMIVPSIVVAVALFQLFAQIGLIATDMGIMIGHAVQALPIAFVILLATLKGHDWRLDQAAATLGANRARVFRRVTMPLIRGGLVGAAIFAFLASFEELTVAMFIGGGLRSTLPKQLWDDVILQVSPVLVAASVVVLVVVTVLFLLAEFLRPARGG